MEFGVANLELESDSRKSGVDSRFGFWPKTRFGVGVDLTPENLEFNSRKYGVDSILFSERKPHLELELT